MVNRSKIKSKKLWIVLFFAVVCTVALFVLSAYKNRLFKAEADRFLPKINQKLRNVGLFLEYGDLSVHLTTGAELDRVKVSTLAESKLLLEVSKVQISHSINLFEKPHLRFKGLTLEGPKTWFHINPDESTNLPAELIDLLSNARKKSDDQKANNKGPLLSKSLADWIEIPDRLMIDWIGGEAEIVEGFFVKTGAPTRLKIEGAKGHAVIDLEKKSFLVKTKAQFEKTGGDIEIKAGFDGKEVEIYLKGKRVRLAPAYAYLPEWILHNPLAEASGTLEIDWNLGSPNKAIHFSGELKQAELNHWRISDRPIRNINIQLSGSFNWFPQKRIIDLELIRFGQQKAFIDLEGTVCYGEPKSVDLRFTCGDMKAQSALDAIPEDFIPVLKGARVAGAIDINLVFQFDEENIRNLIFEPNIVVKDFKLLKSPPLANFEKLKGPFKHVAKKKGQVISEFMVGPSNKDFIPFESLGHYAKRGILTCEDGRFFSHNGFQLKHIKASLIRDLREKRFARGGSTITMQTAKNLFLSGKKNLSRKFQEMLIAYILEQELSKERIFEIYTNIIEWGPNMYGIGRASRHYFFKSPAALDPLEAAYLGSIISNPRRYYYMYSRGEVSATWSTYLALIVSKMGVGLDVYESLEPFQPEFGWVRKKRLGEEKKKKEEQENENSFNLF